MRYFFIGMGVCALTLSACARQEPELRRYEEITVEAEQPPASVHAGSPQELMQQLSSLGGDLPPPPKAPILWKVPSGWKESQASGIRLASFTNPDHPMDCSIISLGGKAGGVRANVIRWMRQINLTLDPARLNSFLNNLKKTTTQTGLPVIEVDLTSLQESAAQDASSMIASIIELQEMVVFVKMTGNKGSLLKNKEQFRSLVHSISLQ